MSYVFWMWPGREWMEEGGGRIPGKTLQLSLPSQVWSVSALVLNSETCKSQVRVSPMGKPSFLLILHQPCYYLGPQYVRFPSIETPEDVERQTCEDQQTKEPSVMDKRQWLLGGYSYSRPKSHSEQWKEDDHPIRGMRELRPQSPRRAHWFSPLLLCSILWCSQEDARSSQEDARRTQHEFVFNASWFN